MSIVDLIQPMECCVPVLMQLYYYIVSTVVVDMERIIVNERSGLVTLRVIILVRAVNHLYTAFPVLKLTSINIGGWF